MPTETFAEFFTRVLGRSGVSFGGMVQGLKQKGYKITKSTLARWANGDTKPRRDKLHLLRHFPELLHMTPAEKQAFNRLYHDLTGVRLSPTPPVTPSRTRPRNHYLGGKMVYFTGREAELEELQTAVFHRQPIIITGLGGIGKTTLARKLLEESAHDFDYGCNALQITPHQRPIDIILQIAQRLSVTMTLKRTDQNVDFALRQLRQAGVNRDMLFLLDNVNSGDQVRPLLNGLPAITWLLTSRQKLYLPAPDLIKLHLSLPELDDAARILLYYAKKTISTDDLPLARQIANQLGCFPIALRTAAGLVATERLSDLPNLQAWLIEHNIQGLQVESWNINYFFAELLAMAQPPAARQLFELCGLFTAPIISWKAFTTIADSLNLPINLSERLENLALIHPHDDDNFALHPLIHEYIVQEICTRPLYSTLQRHFIHYYAEYADERQGKPEDLHDFDNVYIASEYAYKTADWDNFSLLWKPISEYLWRQSRMGKYKKINQQYLEVAQTQGNRYAEARALSRIGWVHFEETEYETAQSYFLRIISISDTEGFVKEGIRARRHLGVLHTVLGSFALAEDYLQEAEDMTQSAVPADWTASRLTMIYHARAGILIEKGEYARAQTYSERALGIKLQLQWQNQIPMIRLRLADNFYLQNRFEEASNIWRAIAINGRKYHPEEYVIAGAMHRVAQVENVNGRLQDALEWAYEARKIYIQGNLTTKHQKIDTLIYKFKAVDEMPFQDRWNNFELWD